MCFESVIGLGVLVVAFVGYIICQIISNINWPLVWFCMKGDT